MAFAINPITLSRAAVVDPALQAKLDETLIRELLGRSKGAGLALLGAVVLLWMVVGDWSSGMTTALFAALVGLAIVRILGVRWWELRAGGRVPPIYAFLWFALMNLLLGICLAAIVLLTYPILPPARVALCSICVLGIDSAALVSMGASPLVYLLYVGSNLAALNLTAFCYPVSGLEHEFQATNLMYGAALMVMLGAVHRALRSGIALRLQLAASLADLGDTQVQLVEASRQAGRADVARAVLHNVGNVLNSVNVSAAMVADLLAHSRTQSVMRVIAMVTQHRDDFAEFFQRDPRAQKLPEYFAQLAELTEREHGRAIAELKLLARNIDHINVIVSSQQSHVQMPDVSEICDVHGLLDDALKFSAASYGPAQIEVVRRFDDLPPATLDRHKALQILMNLFANARDAVMTKQAGERRVTVHARRGQAGELEIAIEDSGCGIAAEHLDKVFVLGFTTKPHGSGLGLHFSACAARELRGNLTAHSAGPGSGASFVLALPFGAETSDSAA
jgi:signal transduction histidine kinase